MNFRHHAVLALALPALLTGCSGTTPDNATIGSAPASSLAVAASAGAAAAKPALTAPSASTAAAVAGSTANANSPVDLATDESCRTLALQTIRKQDAKADRVFLSDSTPAGRYRRDGNRISGAAGQYRTDTGWTPLTSFLCTVDASNNAVSFTYQPGKPQTWAEMGDRH
ncbi:MAG TPA: hypothetical protein VGC19_01780 [Rhodanobacter sp.]